MLALKIEVSEFDKIYNHLSRFKPPYKNMHLRESCQRKNKRELRYLHAMFADKGLIYGIISGLGVYVDYYLQNNNGVIQFNVLEIESDDKNIHRLNSKLLSEILARIDQEIELADKDSYSRTSPGVLYLRRSQDAFSPTHPYCIEAVKKGLLHQPFVERISTWGFRLVKGSDK
jgi:hypothetical protein